MCVSESRFSLSASPQRDKSKWGVWDCVLIFAFLLLQNAISRFWEVKTNWLLGNDDFFSTIRAPISSPIWRFLGDGRRLRLRLVRISHCNTSISRRRTISSPIRAPIAISRVFDLGSILGRFWCDFWLICVCDLGFGMLFPFWFEFSLI